MPTSSKPRCWFCACQRHTHSMLDPVPRVPTPAGPGQVPREVHFWSVQSRHWIWHVGEDSVGLPHVGSGQSRTHAALQPPPQTGCSRHQQSSQSRHHVQYSPRLAGSCTGVLDTACWMGVCVWGGSMGPIQHLGCQVSLIPLV